MSEFHLGGRGNDNPVTREEYQIVREGNGTPEQVARVRAALQDKESPLWLSLGESAPWARMAIERKYRTAEESERLAEALTPIAQKNFYRVIDYLRHKREIGVLTDEEVDTIMKSMRAEHLDDPNPKPSHFAMSVRRMSKAIITLHPELAAEVKALPISQKR